MSTTLKRTSMALDIETLDDLESLSTSWDVSKAEVMRRAIRRAKEKDDKKLKLTPLEALQWFQKNGISREEAENYKVALKAEREAWRDPWENHDTPRH